MPLSKWLFIFFIFFGFNVSAQNQYAVYFVDKPVSDELLAHPENYLSQKSIDRRSKQNIDIDPTDLPVNSSYIDELKSKDLEIKYISKWLNLAICEYESTYNEEIVNLSFVDTTILLGPSVPTLVGKVKGSEKNINTKTSANMASNRQLAMSGIDKLHSDGFTGKGISMAFFDGGFSGVNTIEGLQHIFNSNRLIDSYNFVNNTDDIYSSGNHGTHVFSITAGSTSGTFEGSAYEAEYLLYVTENNQSEYLVEEYNWLIAAERADSIGVDIINSSLGYYDFDNAVMNHTYEDFDGKTTPIAKAVNHATNKGIIVVVSAGNEGDTPWHYITTPADAENVISVGSVSSNYAPSYFSSYGPSSDGRVKPEVAALGSGVSFINELGYVNSGNGTSFSSPIISGLMACLWQKFPEKTAIQLRQLLLENASQYNNPDDRIGYGIGGYEHTKVTAVDNKIDTDLRIYPNPTDDLIFIESPNGVYQVKLYNAVGGTITDTPYNINKADKTISLKNLPRGVYQLIINSGKDLQTFKVIKN